METSAHQLNKSERVNMISVYELSSRVSHLEGKIEQLLASVEKIAAKMEDISDKIEVLGKTITFWRGVLYAISCASVAIASVMISSFKKIWGIN